MQGAAKDSVGAVIQQRYVSLPPYKHRRSAGEVRGQLWRWAPVVLCLVAECSAALSVLENCSRKVLEGSSGESKKWPGKMSGEPTLPERGWSRCLPWLLRGGLGGPTGAGASGQPSVDYTAFYRQHLCEEGSRPQQYTWNSKALFHSRWNIAAHSLHFQHLMWTKGYKFKTSTVKRSLVSIVHVNS